MKIKTLFLVLVSFLFTCKTFGAETSTSAVTITEVNALADTVYFTVSGGSMCSTTVFSLDFNRPRSKEMYAALLAAASAGRKVKLATWGICKSGDPANASGNWGTEVQSIAIQF